MRTIGVFRAVIRILTASFIWLLLLGLSQSVAQQAVTIINNGAPENRIDIVVLGDGYTADELGKFARDVENAMKGFFSEQPFAEYRNYFNVHRIDVASEESGVDHPERNVFKNTAFDASYNCGGVQRAICASTSKVFSAASRVLSPVQRDICLVIVNDSEYGGTGGTIAVVSTHAAVVEVILHEEGHTLGLLADEYGGPPPPNCDTSREPSSPNVTMETQRQLIKWRSWIDPGTQIPTINSQPRIPGLFEGAQYCDTGKYRPTYASKMRVLNGPWDPVNTEQLIRRIYNWVSPIDASSPSSSEVSVARGRRQPFSVSTPSPAGRSLMISWFLDGQAAGQGSQIEIDSGRLSIGIHTVEVRVKDITDKVRDDPSGLLGETRSWRLRITEPTGIPLPLDAGGAAAAATAGVSGSVRTGYASVEIDSTEEVPYGTAVFSLKQNGITISEAGVPPSPATTSARMFIDYRSNVNPVPGRTDLGRVNINTGIVVVNPGKSTANLTYTLRDVKGKVQSVGHGTLAPGAHIACFIDQLREKAAPDFNLPQGFQLGTLEIAGQEPVSVLSLRGTNNQRNDFLITTTPLADLTLPAPAGLSYFPQFADGGGYTTSLILINTGPSVQRGKLQILAGDGSPLHVSPVGGRPGWEFDYEIEPHGVFHFQTDGSPSETQTGWAKIIPGPSMSTPVGSGIFGYNPGSVLVSESGVPATQPTTHARIYVDLANNRNTGIAIANTTLNSASIVMNAYEKDGSTRAGSRAVLPLTGNGHRAAFADQFIDGLTPGFTGMLDIQSEAPFAALTLRSKVNEIGDFLMTAFPVADVNRPAPAPLIFPQIADGGGYTTELILLSPTEASNPTVYYYDESGLRLDMSGN